MNPTIPIWLGTGNEKQRQAHRRDCGVAPLAARQTKRLVTRIGLPNDLEAHLRDELEYARRGLRSDDGKEAVRAIFEKRKPVFSGH